MNVPKPHSPLYKNIQAVKQSVPTNAPSSDIDLTNVSPATSVDDANNKFSSRVAAAIYSALSENLSTLDGENYGVAILARWAYQDYFNVPDGDSPPE